MGITDGPDTVSVFDALSWRALASFAGHMGRRPIGLRIRPDRRPTRCRWGVKDMKQANKRSRLVRKLMALMVGGSAMQLSGCDPAVRSTLLDGLLSTSTSLSAALISAYFQSLESDGT